MKPLAMEVTEITVQVYLTVQLAEQITLLSSASAGLNIEERSNPLKLHSLLWNPYHRPISSCRSPCNDHQSCDLMSTYQFLGFPFLYKSKLFAILISSFNFEFLCEVMSLSTRNLILCCEPLVFRFTTHRSYGIK